MESTEGMPNRSRVPRRIGFGAVIGLALFSATRAFAAVNVSPSWLKGTAWFGLCAALLTAAVWFWEYTENRHWGIRTALSAIVVGLVFLLSYGPVKDQYRREHQPSISQQALTPPNRIPDATNVPDERPAAKPVLRKSEPSRKAETARIGDDNTIVNMPAPSNMGSGNTFVGPTDSNGDTVLNRGGTAIGNGSCADSTSVAIGAGAHAGNCNTSLPTVLVQDNGTWTSHDDTIVSNGQALRIQDNAHVDSTGMKILTNEPIDAAIAAVRVNEFLEETIEDQKLWDRNVKTFLLQYSQSSDYRQPGKTPLYWFNKFKDATSLDEKKNVLRELSDQLRTQHSILTPN